MHSYLGGLETIKPVSWAEWVDTLSHWQSFGSSAADLDRNPGLKLLDFFEGLKKDEETGRMLPAMDTERSSMKSGTFAALKPVGREWMEIWLKQWGF